MARTIQIKRGLKADMPTLADGEFALTTDEEKVYIGLGGVAKEVGRVPGADEIILDGFTPDTTGEDISAEDSTLEAFGKIARHKTEQQESAIKIAELEDEEAIRRLNYISNVGPVKYTMRTENYGSMLVSHPSCLAALNVVGSYGGDHVGINKIIEKGTKSGEGASIIIEAMDLGYPFINKPEALVTHVGRHQTVNGYPVPIFETSHIYPNAEKCAADTLSFAWNGVLYLVVMSHRQLEGVKLNGHLIPTEGSNIANGTVETMGAHQVIAIEEGNGGHWFACGCNPMQAIALKPNEQIPVTTTLTTDTTPTSGSSTFFCLGDNNEALDKARETVFCFSTDFTKAAATEAVAGALSADWRVAYEACKAYWADVFDGLREKWIGIPAKLRVMGYLSLGQMLCHAYKNETITPGMFLGAGSGTWYGNFIRDTAFAIKSLASVSPDIAGELLDFYAGCQPIYGNNSVYIDGVVSSGHNTDNAPTFLLAVGEYYAATQDLARMQALETQINEAMKYLDPAYGDHWVAEDGHIEALHPHDFGDDSNDYFTMADTKYESMVDILWAAGLAAIAPVLTALEEAEKAAFCVTVSESLIDHLDDYIVQSGDRQGMMAHGIKTDDTLDEADGLWGATFIYGAWMLGLESCWEWCKISREYLTSKGSGIPYCLTIANNYASGSRDHGWGPFYPLVALLEYQYEGSSKTAFELADYFPSGAWPEFITQNASTDGLPQQYSHAMNFPWSHASVLELVSALANKE